jgi:photosystem II stability/assembly factor-like uncharacterized protein
MKNTALFLFSCLLVIFSSNIVKAGETIQSKQSNYTWEPININGGGFTNFIIVNPQEPNVVYAGVDVGGVYKSIDYGEHWIPSNKGLNWPTDRSPAALSIDQNGVIYLGVGGYGKGGIFKSIDDAKSWRLLTRKIKYNGIGKHVLRPGGKRLIIIDPSDSKVIYAGSYKDGIFKSTDGGNTWFGKGLEGKRISSILISPANPQTIYVSSVLGKEEEENSQGGLYRSRDGGKNWERIGNGIIDVHQLVMDHTDHNIIYASCGAAGIFKTSDGGTTWIDKNKGLEELIPAKFKLSSINYVSLAIDPKNPAIIYTGSGVRRGQIYKSVNGGDQWTKLTGNKENIYPDGWWIKETNRPGDVGYFANCLSIDPVNNERIYVSGRSGIWRSDDSGVTWHAKVKGLEATCLRQIAFDPKKQNVFFVASGDWIFFRSLDGGKTFERSLKGIGNWDEKEDKNIWEKYRMKNGLCFAIDPRHEPSTVYLGGGATGINSGTIFKSTNGGKDWHGANTGLPVAGVTSLAIDPSNYNTLFAALTERGLYKTINCGKNWEKVNMGKFNYGNFSQGKAGNLILIHPKFNNIIYILDKGIGVYKTVNGGKDWEIISENLPHEGIKGMDQFVGGMALDLNNPSIVYIGLRNHGIYKSTDGGKKWMKITPSYMRHGGAMSIDPADGCIYFASVPGVGDEDIEGFVPGIYKSSDDGKSWFPIHTDDLLNISLKVTSLAIDPHSKGKIYLTTQGNGIIVGEPDK